MTSAQLAHDTKKSASGFCFSPDSSCLSQLQSLVKSWKPSCLMWSRLCSGVLGSGSEVHWMSLFMGGT